MNPPNSREIILDRAMKRFSEKGYDAVGVHEIASAAEVKKPTLYYFFHSKEGLFRAIMETYYEPFLEQLQSVCRYQAHPSIYEQDVLPLLTNVLRFSIQYAGQNPEFYRLMISLIYAPPVSLLRPVYVPYRHRYEQIFVRMFETIAQAHPNLKGKESQIAVSLMGTIHANIAAMIDETINDQPIRAEWKREDGEKRSREIVHQFMHGIFV